MLKSRNDTIFKTLGRNSIHPFPARMAPEIALGALGDGDRSLRVLDPMAGSGTVLAVARKNGHRAFGVDLDPLAVLLAGVWTRAIDPAEVREQGAIVLGRAKVKMKSLTSARAYPVRADEETKEFIRYWFDGHARRQLCALATSIRLVQDSRVRDVLWCGFSRLIIVKQAGASLAMDLSHSRPHRKFTRAPVKPFDRFASAVEYVITNCLDKDGVCLGPPALVKRGDARKMPIVSESIDLVLTSPPYLNAIDYIRCSKFSLVWMGYSAQALRQIRAASVGTEVACEEALDTEWVRVLMRQLRLGRDLSARKNTLLATYALDMSRAMSEVGRVLCRGGRAVYVIGDSTIKGTFVRNSRILTEVAARCGLNTVSRHTRLLPTNRRYLPPPSLCGNNKMLNGRMRREVVIEFSKE